MSFSTRLLRTLAANFTSRKFWITITALWIEWSAYWIAISLIYTFRTSEQLNAFVSITQHFQWATTTILLGYLSIQTMNNFSNAATQATQNLLQNVVSHAKSEHKETRENIHRIIRDNADKRRDDPSYAPIKPDTEETFR